MGSLSPSLFVRLIPAPTIKEKFAPNEIVACTRSVGVGSPNPLGEARSLSIKRAMSEQDGDPLRYEGGHDLEIAPT